MMYPHAVMFVKSIKSYPHIKIFRQQQNNYKQVSNIPTRSGARTSLLIPQLRVFLLAERAAGSKNAELVIYKVGEWKISLLKSLRKL